MRLAVSFSSTQMQTIARPLGAGGAQHVAPRAVAEIDAEAEARRLADALGVGVDDGRVDVRASSTWRRSARSGRSR